MYKEPDEFCSRLKQILNDCGIVLVFLPHLKGSFLQGATFYDGHKIVVGLTARGKDADKFWFSLFHELAHIVLGHVGKTGGTTEQDEIEADQWARDMLIDPDAFALFRDEKDYSKEKILSFAARQGIAPGIVVGRMQNDGMIKYSTLNHLKVQYEIEV